MLSLSSSVRIPAHVMFSVVGEEAFLLNTRTNRYFLLDAVGVRLWECLNAGQRLQQAYQDLLLEYKVDGAQLQQDLMELLEKLQENGLVEIIQA